jgi:nitrogen fixation protein FixH
MNVFDRIEPSFVERWVAARWALMPFLLLGGLGTGLLVIVRIAVHDPGFAVDPDYYQHALKWDTERARQQRSADLGWTVEWDFSTSTESQGKATTHARALGLTLRGAQGQPIRGANVVITAFHNARAAEVQHLKAVDQAGGHYTAELDMPRAGIWNFQVNAELGSDSFVLATQVDLNAQQGRLYPDTTLQQRPAAAPRAGQQ